MLLSLRLSSLDPAGQIELYTHIPLLPRLLSHLQSGNLQFRISAVYLLESQFAQADKAKFFAGVMSAMSCMLSLGCGMLCLMSKMDLIKGPAGGTGKGPQGRKKIGKEIGRYLDTDTTLLLEDANKQTNPRFHALNQAIVNLVSDRAVTTLPCPSCSFVSPLPRYLLHLHVNARFCFARLQIEDHSIVSFLPLDITNEDSLTSVLSHIDHTMQYGEDEEPKAPEDLDGGESGPSTELSSLVVILFTDVRFDAMVGDFGGDGDAE
jgi:hypothetical protein